MKSDWRSCEYLAQQRSCICFGHSITSAIAGVAASHIGATSTAVRAKANDRCVVDSLYLVRRLSWTVFIAAPRSTHCAAHGGPRQLVEVVDKSCVTTTRNQNQTAEDSSCRNGVMLLPHRTCACWSSGTSAVTAQKAPPPGTPPVCHSQTSPVPLLIPPRAKAYSTTLPGAVMAKLNSEGIDVLPNCGSSSYK